MTLKDELIEQIKKSKNFTMAKWGALRDDYSDDEYSIPTCDTACCMGGTLAALRPELAVEFGWLEGECPSTVATKIWEHEMGEACYLDFFAHKHPLQEKLMRCHHTTLTSITKGEVLAHIEAGDGRWPSWVYALEE